MTPSSPADSATDPSGTQSRTPPRTDTIGIVVPAHNEGLIIKAFLERLLSQAEGRTLDILVVANGCTDQTVEIASSVGGVTVIETPVGDKPTALDLADEHGTAFPRFYVDADVDTTVDDLFACADALDGTVHAVAPRLSVDTTGSDRFVQSYYAIWNRLPWATVGMIGSGIYGLSEEGRARFKAFHPQGADDLWVSAHFAPDERSSVPGTQFTVKASPTVRQTIRRKSRIHAANQLIRPDIAGLPGDVAPAGATVKDLVKDEPRLLPHLAVYVTITAAARLIARRKIARGEVEWDGDART